MTAEELLQKLLAAKAAGYDLGYPVAVYDQDLAEYYQLIGSLFEEESDVVPQGSLSLMINTME